MDLTPLSHAISMPAISSIFCWLKKKKTFEKFPLYALELPKQIDEAQSLKVKVVYWFKLKKQKPKQTMLEKTLVGIRPKAMTDFQLSHTLSPFCLLYLGNFVLFHFLFWGTGLSMKQGWLKTHTPPASPFQMLGLQSRTTIAKLKLGEGVWA